MNQNGDADGLFGIINSSQCCQDIRGDSYEHTINFGHSGKPF